MLFLYYYKPVTANTELIEGRVEMTSQALHEEPTGYEIFLRSFQFLICLLFRSEPIKLV